MAASGPSVYRPSVSVVISTMGRLEMLKPCVGALRQQQDVTFDLTIVVGPESESTRRWLLEEHKDVRVVDCPLANLAVSRNLGWRYSQGELIAFIDDDAIPFPRWLKLLAEPFRIAPRVGAAGGFVRDHTGARWQWQYLTIDPLCNPVEATAADYHGPVVAKGPLDSAAQRFYYPPGTNMMFRRSALELVGGFDETYAYAADDAELCLRLYAAGWHIAQVPSTEVVHRYAPSHQRDHARVPRTLRDTARSFVYFKLRQGRRYFETEKVLRSVLDYVSGMHSWVNALARDGRLDSLDAGRLHAEIDEGARDAVRRALRPAAAPAPITANLRPAIDGPRSFVVLPAHPRRLRLCFVAREMPPAPSGGIGIWVWTLGRELARLGHEVHLIAQGQDHATVDWIEGCWVHRMPTPDYGKRQVPDLSDAPFFIRNHAYRVFDTVARLEAERHFDVVCAPIWEAQGIGIRRGRRGLDAVSLHTPLRTVVRTSRTWMPDEVWFHEYGDPVMAAEAELATTSGLVLANSESIVEEIEREYEIRIPRDRLAIVPHGVDDAPAWSGTGVISAIRRLLFVGRFEGRKGIDILLGALPRLLSNHSNLVAELVGENRIPAEDGRSLLQSFREQHSTEPWLDRIRTPGQVDEAALLDAYRTCDVFVAPSRFESFGLIFLEAMRFGKPVVALDSGGAREIIRPNETGILVRGDDPAALADALDRLVSDLERCKAMGRRARADYEARFTAKAMAEGVVEAFLRGVSHSRARLAGL